MCYCVVLLWHWIIQWHWEQCHKFVGCCQQQSNRDFSQSTPANKSLLFTLWYSILEEYQPMIFSKTDYAGDDDSWSSFLNYHFSSFISPNRHSFDWCFSMDGFARLLYYQCFPRSLIPGFGGDVVFPHWERVPVAAKGVCWEGPGSKEIKSCFRLQCVLVPPSPCGHLWVQIPHWVASEGRPGDTFIRNHSPCWDCCLRHNFINVFIIVIIVMDTPSSQLIRIVGCVWSVILNCQCSSSFCDSRAWQRVFWLLEKCYTWLSKILLIQGSCGSAMFFGKSLCDSIHVHSPKRWKPRMIYVLFYGR